MAASRMDVAATRNAVVGAADVANHVKAEKPAGHVLQNPLETVRAADGAAVTSPRLQMADKD